MKLHYARGSGFGRFNFGDELNLYLWQHLLPEGFFDDDPSTLFFGIGTLLNARWVPGAQRRIVAGSGAGIGQPPAIDASWTILAVRGPLTARAIGIDEALAITDPALLVRHVWPHGIEVDPSVAPLSSGRPGRVRPRATAPTKQFDVAYIPHFAEACINGAAWREVCADLGVHYIDPTEPVDVVLNAVLASRHLLTEAMHGAIVADAYRVPWTSIRTHKDINDAKWSDWALSMGVEDLATRLWRPMYRLENGNWVRRMLTAATMTQFKRAVAGARPQLSTDRVVQDRQERLLEMIRRCAALHAREA